MKMLTLSSSCLQIAWIMNTAMTKEKRWWRTLMKSVSSASLLKECTTQSVCNIWSTKYSKSTIWLERIVFSLFHSKLFLTFQMKLLKGTSKRTSTTTIFTLLTLYKLCITWCMWVVFKPKLRKSISSVYLWLILSMTTNIQDIQISLLLEPSIRLPSDTQTAWF